MKITTYYKMLITLALIFNLTGCGGEEEVPNDPPESVVIDSGSLNLDVNGVNRHLNYRVPALDTYPLVIALHGGGDSISSFENYTNITSLVNRDKDFGVVYPEGINEHWNDGRAESGSTADDISFIEKIISEYKTKGADKFYLVGMSNGGVMAQSLACTLADQIEGIVVVSATQSTYLQNNCIDTITPINTLFIFGDDDRAFIDNGDIITPGFPGLVRGTHILMQPTINYWLNRNGCLATLSTTQTLDVINDGQTSVVIKEGSNCNQKTAFYDVVNGGHRWPDPSGSNDIVTTGFLGHASHEISSAQEMINFFGL